MNMLLQYQIRDRARIGSLQQKQIEELNFWKNIRKNGWRGFTPEEWRIAHIHFKQYSLMYINRNIGDLKNKIVVEIGCGPAGIIPYTHAASAIGIDQLMDEYQKMWDLSSDGVKYISNEIESFNLTTKADIVICWNVLDHVRDIYISLKKIYNLLKDDGELWFMINLEDRSKSAKVIKGNENAAHPWKVNLRSISILMSKNGLFWKEKMLMKDYLNNRRPILMGVLGKSIGNKKGQKRILQKVKQIFSNLMRIIVS